MTVDGSNSYALPCGATGGAEGNSDTLTVRRATVDPVAPDGKHLQIQTSRIQGQLFQDTNIPAGFSAAVDPVTGQPDSTTHDLIVNSYYVAADSNLIPNTPTLRRKSLDVSAAAPPRSSTRRSPRASRTCRSSSASTSTRTTPSTAT